MSARWWVGVAVLAAVGFAAGRRLGTREPDVTMMERRAESASAPVARAPAAAEEPAPAGEPAGNAGAARAPALAVHAASAWSRMVEEQPDAAMAIHQAVLGAMERRRRAMHLRACAIEGRIGRSSLAFEVQVEVRGARVAVGDASGGIVEDGVAIEPAVIACVAQQLRGHDDVQMARGVRDYAGEVPYRFAVDFGSTGL